MLVVRRGAVEMLLVAAPGPDEGVPVDPYIPLVRLIPQREAAEARQDRLRRHSTVQVRVSTSRTPPIASLERGGPQTYLLGLQCHVLKRAEVNAGLGLEPRFYLHNMIRV